MHNSNLANDIHRQDESKVNINDTSKKKSKPTPVTIANIRGGKKDREIKHEGLRVLLDCGASDSLIFKKYANTLKKSIKCI